MDASARRRERELSEGEPADEVGLLARHLREGRLERARLEVAADLGHEAAGVLLERDPAEVAAGRPLSLDALLERLAPAGGPTRGPLAYALAQVTLENLRAIGLPPAQREALGAVCEALARYALEDDATSRAALVEVRRATWPELEAVESADGTLGLPWLWPGESDSLTGRIPLDLVVAFVVFVGVELEGDPGRALLHTLRWAGHEVGLPILVQDLREAALRWALAPR